MNSFCDDLVKLTVCYPHVISQAATAIGKIHTVSVKSI